MDATDLKKGSRSGGKGHWEMPWALCANCSAQALKDTNKEVLGRALVPKSFLVSARNAAKVTVLRL